MQLVANCSVFCSWRWGGEGGMDKVALHLEKLFSKPIGFPIPVITVPLLHHQWLVQQAHLMCCQGTLGCPTWTTSRDNYIIIWYDSHRHIYICIYFLLPLAVFRIAQLVQWLGYTLDDWETKVWFLAMEWFHSIQNGSGAHHAYAQGLKEQYHAADHSCQLVVTLRICGDILHLPHMPPRCNV